MKKIEEFKRPEVFRDPIYNYIYFNYVLLEQLVNTKAFQRLRRIRQLSCTNIIFHSAEHSRFTHSLGVYELARRFLEFKHIKGYFDLRTSLLLMVTALMHDVGHGPYSHVFEKFFDFNHEEKSAQIIIHNPEISSLLDDKIDQQFKYDVASILRKQHIFPLLEQILTSQLDFDRLDYLERDAYFTGAIYGHVDSHRLMRSMVIKNHQIVFKSSGIYAIENYLINRYHMYWQIYHHPKVRSYLVILEKIYKRIQELIQEKKLFGFYIDIFINFIENKNNLDNYLEIDDYYINGLIIYFKNSSDVILKTLCNDFLNRKIWFFIDNIDQNKSKIQIILNHYQNTQNETHYTELQNIFQNAYDEKGKNFWDKILILDDKDNKIKTLKNQSNIIDSIIQHSIKKDSKFFYRPF